MPHNHGTKPPKGEPWTPTIDVILDITDPKNKKFHFESADIDIGKDNAISFYNEDQPGFIITFRLKNPPGGYRFPENLKEALWVVEQPVCPDENNNKEWGQFKAKAVNNGGLDLVVRNLNNDQKSFGYAPRVTTDGVEFWNLDPVGTNENGGYGKLDFSTYATIAIAGAVGGAIATLGIEELMGLNPLG